MEPTYVLIEYQEAGQWKEYFRSHKLWECEYQASRLQMPWRIVHSDGGEVVMRGHGEASVLAD